MPDGHVVRRDFLHYDGAVAVLPVLDDGSIVLIRNYRFAVDEHLLEVPAGMLEPGEPPAACAARELREETGYTAAGIEELGRFYTGPGTTDEVMHTYLATGLTAGGQDLEAYEEITVQPVTEAAAREMILSGELHDGKTIAALTLYWLKRGEP
jgi:ADP-ribose pyrophosphatase